MARTPQKHDSTSALLALDPDKAKSAFAAIEPMARDLPIDGLVKGNINFSAAAVAAVGVANRCMEAPLYDRFKKLPAEEFNMKHLDGLSNLAWGTWFAADQAASLKAQKTTAKLPAELVQQALDVEARMQRCCEYHLADHPVWSKELDRLRPGVDYSDLAGDLAGYARLYEANHEVVSRDTKNFRATDREDALRISAQIISLLGEGMTSEAKRATELAQRCFTLLVLSYDEVAETGKWLLRADPNVYTYFPSLWSIARRPAARASTTPSEPPSNTNPPAATP